MGIQELIDFYGLTLPADRQRLLERYRLADVPRPRRGPVFQAKEAERSVPEPYPDVRIRQ